MVDIENISVCLFAMATCSVLYAEEDEEKPSEK